MPIPIVGWAVIALGTAVAGYVAKNFFEDDEPENKKFEYGSTILIGTQSSGKTILANWLAYNELKEKPLKTVIYSTAEWTKFSPTVLNALKQNNDKYSDKEALEEISTKYNATLPQTIKDLFSAKINHSLIIEKENIEAEIVKFIRES